MLMGEYFILASVKTKIFLLPKLPGHILKTITEKLVIVSPRKRTLNKM